MSWRYCIEGEGENIAIKRYKGFYSKGKGVTYHSYFYKIFHNLCQNELVVLHYLVDQMNIRNEIEIDSSVYEGLSCIMGYFENEEKPANYRYPLENVSTYVSKLKAREGILIKGEGKTWLISPYIAFKGSKTSRSNFIALYMSYKDMKLNSPNIVFNYNAMCQFTNEVNDIINQHNVDKNNQNSITRLKKANKKYKEIATINKKLVPARIR